MSVMFTLQAKGDGASLTQNNLAPIVSMENFCTHHVVLTNSDKWLLCRCIREQVDSASTLTKLTKRLVFDDTGRPHTLEQ